MIRTVGERWISGDSLFVRLTRSSVESGNISIGMVGVEFFGRFEETFDVVSEWGNEYGKRVAGTGPNRGTPLVHMSKTFARRFAPGDVVRFDGVSPGVVRMSLVGGPAGGG